jgi:hypothetical protein
LFPNKEVAKTREERSGGSIIVADVITVSELPKGWGSGVLLKDGNEVVIQHGRIVDENVRGKISIVLEQFSEKEGVLGKPKKTFDGETEVKEWEQDSVCAFCAMICNGTCEDATEEV